ncbi:hypothetical protein [Brevundimonas sp.]|uniref:hypothetical protein n=1 Tax=Brevundimonas sp. TaxID=1871086 RepID=UPI003569464A
MRELIPLKALGAGAAAALAMGLATATPASAQSYGSDPVLGAIVRGVLAATGNNGRYGYDQNTYRGEKCQYYRDSRCYRNQGHWEREHGINSRDRNQNQGYGYGYGQSGYQEGRTYSGRGYYREGRFWRNHGQWRSYQNRSDRDYRYDRRW